MDIKLGRNNHQWGFIGSQLGDLNYPEFIEANSKFIIVTERDNHRMQIFNNFGEVSNYKLFGEMGKGYNKLYHPAGVVTSSMSNADIVVADRGNKRVNYYGLRTDKDGYGEINQTSSFGSLIFEEPMGIAYDQNHNVLVVADPGRRRLTYHDFVSQQFLRAVDYMHSDRQPIRRPYDVTIDIHGRAFVTDHESNCVFCFEGNGKHLFTFGKDHLSEPWGICFDLKKEYLYISDMGNNRILKYSPEGVLLKEVGKFTRPKGLSVNVHGNLVVTTEDPLSFIKMVGFKSLEHEP